MSTAPSPNDNLLTDFVTGVEDNLQDEKEPLVMYGPEWARSSHDVGEPPGGLDDPIWSERTGWTEKDPRAGYILCLYTEE